MGIRKISRSPGIYLKILKNGLPSFSRQGLASAASILLNKQALIYGDAAVASIALVSKIFMLIFSVMIGFGQGYQPVAGFNYGAGKMKRVKDSVKFTLVAGVIVMSAAAAAVFFAAPWLIGLFVSDDPKVLEIGTLALRAQALSMPLIPIGTVANMTFQSVGKAWTATIMSSMRQGIFFLPLIFVLPRMLGLWGVITTQAAADVLTALACTPFLWKFYKEICGKD